MRGGSNWSVHDRDGMKAGVAADDRREKHEWVGNASADPDLDEIP